MSHTRRIASAILEDTKKQGIVKPEVTGMPDRMMRLSVWNVMMCRTNSMCMMNFSMHYDT